MRLADAFRRFVAVESPVRREVRASPPSVLAPAAGARWGRPATFDVASRNRASDEPTGFTARWVDNYRLFRGDEVHREFGISALPGILTDAREPEAVRSITFYCGTRTLYRYVGGALIRDVVDDYVKLNFPFGLQGVRGEPHPPATYEEDPDDG
jgi:hypothetical protein